MDLKAVLDRIERRLVAVGMSASRASKEAGLSNSAIRNLQRGVADGTAKGTNITTLQKLAPVLKTTVPWLLDGEGAEDVGKESYELDIDGLPIIGKINAGVWRDTSIFENEGEVRMLPVARDPRFPHARQYCLEVEGDSMDLEFPNGSYVTCVDFAESGLSLREKMTVHVERRRFGGQLVEITLKMVDRVNGEIHLVPRSTNPKHEPFRLPKYKEGVPTQMGDSEILVKGVVVGKYQEVAW